MPLTPGTYTLTVSVNDSSGSSSSGDFTWTVNADITAPIISNISHGTPDVDSATITWSTNEDCTANVDYGLSTSYTDSAPIPADTTPNAKSHSVHLSGLLSSTLYYYKLTSNDFAGNSSDAEGSFTTAGGVLPIPVWLPHDVGTERRLDTDDSAGGVEVWDVRGHVTGTVATWNTVDDTTPAPDIVSGVIQFPARHGTSIFRVSAGNSGGDALSDDPVFIWDRAGVAHTINLNIVDPEPAIGATAIYTTSVALPHPVAATGVYYRWESDLLSGDYKSNVWNDVEDVWPGRVVGGTTNRLEIPNYQLSDDCNIRCRVRSYDPDYDAFTQYTNVATLTEGTGNPPDVTGPVISNLSNGSPGANGATITWDTNEAGNSSVGYSDQPGDFSNVTTPTGSYVTSHSVPLTGLTEDTRYYYKAYSVDQAGNPSTGADTGDFLTGSVGAAEYRHSFAETADIGLFSHSRGSIATFVDENQDIVEVASGAPAWPGLTSGGACSGLQIEEASQNMIDSSENLSGGVGWWVLDTQITATYPAATSLVGLPTTHMVNNGSGSWTGSTGVTTGNVQGRKLAVSFYTQAATDVGEAIQYQAYIHSAGANLAADIRSVEGPGEVWNWNTYVGISLLSATEPSRVFWTQTELDNSTGQLRLHIFYGGVDPNTVPMLLTGVQLEPDVDEPSSYIPALTGPATRDKVTTSLTLGNTTSLPATLPTNDLCGHISGVHTTLHSTDIYKLGGLVINMDSGVISLTKDSGGSLSTPDKGYALGDAYDIRWRIDGNGMALWYNVQANPETNSNSTDLNAGPTTLVLDGHTTVSTIRVHNGTVADAVIEGWT